VVWPLLGGIVTLRYGRPRSDFLYGFKGGACGAAGPPRLSPAARRPGPRLLVRTLGRVRRLDRPPVSSRYESPARVCPSNRHPLLPEGLPPEGGGGWLTGVLGPGWWTWGAASPPLPWWAGGGFQGVKGTLRDSGAASMMPQHRFVATNRAHDLDERR
jgi:hypothetical protein